mmetsp:Transcript_10927/g.33746  ORF Transcript_10927/g.33746 Transcript_10927/m.33746 type:complete len:233 (+) Transcript_10927:211-909(+)
MSSQAAVAANREKRTPARAHAASLPPWSVGAVEGEAVGAHVSVTPHEVASQPAPKNASSRDQGGSDLTVHQPRVWLKEEAFWNMPGILRSAPVSHSPMGLRGRCLAGRRAERPSIYARRGSVPRRRELVEGGGAEEHERHLLDRARLPLTDGLVEGFGLLEHPRHIQDRARLPLADGLVERGGAVEHVRHIQDRARLPLADGPARTLPRRASSRATFHIRASRISAAQTRAG